MDAANGFNFKRRMILFAMAFSILAAGVNGRVREQLAKQMELEVERKLNLLNKPAVKSIRSEDGDIIDCVDIYKQPAFDHPLLKNHIIQMKPNFDLQGVKGEASSNSSMASQVWLKSGSCPEGTIPIRRVMKTDLLKAASLENFGKTNPHIIQYPNVTKSKEDNAVANPTAVLLTQGYSYNGGMADFNVWNPNVEADDEYTATKLSLRYGAYNAYSAIEAGWMVNPGTLGDRKTRLFVSWTDDAGKTGCINLLCPGFVQTSSKITLGASIEPTSTIGGDQYQITLAIAMEPDTGKWWLFYGQDHTPIGYWMPSIFADGLKYQASSVYWGGTVFTKKLGKPHTATAMGSGQFAEYRFSCFVKNIRIRDNSLSWKFPEWISAYQNQYNCYDAYIMREGATEPEFYFGGPGRNPRCP